MCPHLKIFEDSFRISLFNPKTHHKKEETLLESNSFFYKYSKYFKWHLKTWLENCDFFTASKEKLFLSQS